MNPNYDSYLQTATQLQRWRDFQAHVVAYLVINIVFVVIWALTGQGFFWPVYPLVGWAVGLSFQHFSAAEIVMSREEWESAQGMRGRGRGYLPQVFPSWLRPRTVELRGNPVGPFPASYPLTGAGNVLLVPTRSHTFGHLSVIVEQPGEPRLVLAGDASYRQDLMLDGVVDGVAADERAAHAVDAAGDAGGPAGCRGPQQQGDRRRAGDLAADRRRPCDRRCASPRQRPALATSAPWTRDHGTGHWGRHRGAYRARRAGAQITPDHITTTKTR